MTTPPTHTALNWRGDLNDLTDEQRRERADAMAWWIANNCARGEQPNASHGGVNDPVVEFAAARDAWLERNEEEPNA